MKTKEMKYGAFLARHNNLARRYPEETKNSIPAVETIFKVTTLDEIPKSKLEGAITLLEVFIRDELKNAGKNGDFYRLRAECSRRKHTEDYRREKYEAKF